MSNTTNPEPRQQSESHRIADIFRDLASSLEKAIETGHRSRRIDADDLIETLLAVADRLDEDE
ncbi:hypothetical protein KOR42_41550 [Thalassoglobus neptunius]|uniref:Uncharacterized protein n=1 Tax=Thalassoglobus neptunius TaxID=1938619 RepID=A0A5C5W9I8_9PLAN|nr:hypothetical protein [Thalassoglobus neptunius]TWT47157.1 hypothetical protein KOR42_41550 [Thalassoglobus neptunius]